MRAREAHERTQRQPELQTVEVERGRRVQIQRRERGRAERVADVHEEPRLHGSQPDEHASSKARRSDSYVEQSGGELQLWGHGRLIGHGRIGRATAIRLPYAIRLTLPRLLHRYAACVAATDAVECVADRVAAAVESVAERVAAAEATATDAGGAAHGSCAEAVHALEAALHLLAVHVVGVSERRRHSMMLDRRQRGRRRSWRHVVLLSCWLRRPVERWQLPPPSSSLRRRQVGPIFVGRGELLRPRAGG